MRIIMIDNCFQCPFCSPGTFTDDGVEYNGYRCRKTGNIIENERTSIDAGCQLEEVDDDDFNMIAMMKQTILDLEEEIRYAEEDEDVSKDKIIYEFLKDSFGFEGNYDL